MTSRLDSLRLGDVCIKIGSGATPRGGKDSYLTEGPYTLVRSQNVLNNAFSWDGLVRISEKQAAALDGVSLSVNDVLLNITGDSVARACQVDARALPGRVNQHVAIIRPDGSVLDPGFLRYYLTSPAMQAHMLAMAGAGATRSALTKSMIEDFVVLAPGIEIQRQIARILGRLDTKIELNQRIQSTMDELSTSLFEELLTRGRTSDGVLAHGWREGVVADVARVSSGKRPGERSKQMCEGCTVPLYGGAGVMGYTTEPLFEESVLLTGRVGTLGVVMQTNGGSWPSDNTLVIRPMEDRWLRFLFHALQQMNLIGLNRGSTQPLLSQADLKSQRLLIPPDKVLDEFRSVVEPMYLRSVAAERQSFSLAGVRDTLAPRLLSGELSIRDDATVEPVGQHG